MKYVIPHFIVLIAACITVSGCVSHKPTRKAGASDFVSRTYTDNEEALEYLAVAEKITISDVTMSKGPPGMGHEERVIGVVTNGSDVSVKLIRLNLIFKDQNGRLLDVISGEMYNQGEGNGNILSGILGPNKSKGFLVKRPIGNFRDPEPSLVEKRAQSVDVTISDFILVREGLTPKK